MAAMETKPLRAALFLDFDNIFIGLRERDRSAARRFATDPVKWLSWIERGLPGSEGGNMDERRVLVRRCYLNPVTFHEFRGDFTKAAFTVIDCPPLTTHGKTSADIYMALDILDALDHQTHFDEFLILSGDSDFTPVVLRLRAHDRKTVIVTTEHAAASYKSAADLVIEAEDFMELALAETPGRALAAAAAATATPSPEPPPAASAGLPAAAAADRDLKQEVVRHAVRMVADAVAPVPLARVASYLQRDLGPNVVSAWARGGLKNLLEKSVPELRISAGIPGYLYDPTRHATPPETETAEAAVELPDQLDAFARRVSRMTGVPLLSPRQYSLVFHGIENHLKSNRFDLTATSRMVRDWCGEQGESIARKNISFVVQGIQYAGHKFKQGDPAATLGRTFRKNVNTLCRNAQLTLSKDEEKLLDEWFVAGLPAGEDTVAV